MTPVNKGLMGLLAVQLVLVGLMWRPTAEVSYEPRPVLTFGADAITGLEIFGRTAEGEVPSTVKLVKEGNHWQIASAEGYPADPTKVTEVANHLADMKVRAPIATQVANHAALEVADAKNTRRVLVTAGAETVEIMLGAGSGSAVNVRDVSSDEVFSVRGFTAWSIGDSPSRYYDNVYLKADKETIDSVTVINDNGAFTLEKDATGWHVAGAEEGTRVDESAIDTFLTSATTIRMTGPAGKTDLPAWGLGDGPRVEWTVSQEGQTTGAGYTIGAEIDSKVYLRADDNPFAVQVNKSSVSKALEIAVEDLLLSPADDVQ